MDALQTRDRIRDARRARNAETGRQRRQEEVQRQILEVEEFLDSLGRRIETLRDSGVVLDGDEHGPPRFIDYARTRNLTSECMAFMLVIERRIDAMPEELSPPARAAFRSLTVALWSTLLDCSLTFLRGISQEDNLPLGSREVFMREIKTLHDAHKVLSDGTLSEMVSEHTLAKHHQAEKILTEIIDRAPQLLDLGN